MKVLLVEDSADDTLLIQEALSEEPIELHRAERLSTALDHAGNGGFDAILLDLSLPNSYGVENIKLLQHAAPAVPIVVLTGHNDEQAAVDAVAAGAQDYLIKGQTDGHLLARSLRYAIHRHKAEEALIERNRELLVLRNICETILGSLDLTWILDKVLEQTMLNGSFDIGNIRLLDPSGDTLKILSTRGYTRLENDMTRPMRDSRGVRLKFFVREARLTEPFVQTNVQSQPGHVTFRAEGVETYVIVPIVAGTTILGLLQLGSRTARTFRESELQLLKTIGAQLGIALQKARLHEETKNQACALEIAAKMQADFTAMIAHDLRSPLINISGAAEVMLDGAFGSVTEDQRKWLGRIVENCRGLVGLVTDFLDLSKLEAGHIALDKEPLNLGTLINDTVENYRIVADKKQISINHSITASNTSIEADPRRLAQVLGNLISNAIKFTETGGAVQVELSAGASEFEIRVRDTGIGIPANEIPRLFEKYRQCSNVGQSGHQGTGLGLVICKMVIEAHGGHIGVRSEEGRGSTFVLSLPKQPALHAALSAA